MLYINLSIKQVIYTCVAYSRPTCQTVWAAFFFMGGWWVSKAKKIEIFIFFQFFPLFPTGNNIWIKKISARHMGHDTRKIQVYLLYKALLLYRVTNKGRDFRDDCTEFIKSLFLHSQDSVRSSLNCRHNL